VIISLEAARERLCAVADLIGKARMDLLDIKRGLPLSRREQSREVDLDDNPSASTEMRTVIDCVNHELESVVQALFDASAYRPARRSAGSENRERAPMDQGDRTESLRPAEAGLFPQADWIAFYGEEGDRALRQVLSGARRLADSKRKSS
jgi:hypothetical protein